MKFRHYAKPINIPHEFTTEERAILIQCVEYYISKNKERKFTKNQALAKFDLNIQELELFNRKVKNLCGQYAIFFEKKKEVQRDKRNCAKLSTVSPTEYAKLLGVEIGKEWTPSHSYWNDL